MPTTIVTEGYVEKSEKGYLVEADFWGAIYSWDINDAEFWPKDGMGCSTGTKAARITVIYEEHAPLIMKTGFTGKNLGKVQWICPRCHRGSNKNRDPEAGKEYMLNKPCSITTIREYGW